MIIIVINVKLWLSAVIIVPIKLMDIECDFLGHLFDDGRVGIATCVRVQLLLLCVLLLLLLLFLLLWTSIIVIVIVSICVIVSVIYVSTHVIATVIAVILLTVTWWCYAILLSILLLLLLLRINIIVSINIIILLVIHPIGINIVSVIVGLSVGMVFEIDYILFILNIRHDLIAGLFLFFSYPMYDILNATINPRSKTIPTPIQLLFCLLLFFCDTIHQIFEDVRQG